MSSQPTVNVHSLIAEYIKARQDGRPIEEAARDLQVAVMHYGLSHTERNELAQLTQNWESRYGVNFNNNRTPAIRRLSPRSDSDSGVRSMPLPPAQVPTTAPLAPFPSAPQPPANVIRPLRQNNSQEQTWVNCPNCKKQNRRGDLHCYACGSLLQEMNQATTRQLTDEVQHSVGYGTYFDESSVLLLTIRAAGKVLEVRPSAEQTIIGRSSNDTPIKPDIDLGPFDGASLGVSRMHVCLHRRDRALTITDMNSSNRTFINGQRLHPQEVRVLTHGDEIRLGRLALKVEFRHPLISR